MTIRYRLAIVATHPIQYQAPWFRALASHPQIDLEVLFGHRVTSQEQADAGFGVKFEWDTPLLEGYRHRFLRNVAARPGVDRFSGIDTPEIGTLIAQRKYDAVILSCGWYVKSAWQTMVACWKSRTPIMVRGDSHLHTPRSAAKRAVKALAYRCFVPRFDACLCVGKWSRQYFLHYGARTDRVFFVPHVLDEDRFSSESRDREARARVLRDRWQLDPGSTVYLFAGKFMPQKRPLDFIRAVALAAKDAPNVQGLMVGDGPMRAECESLVQEIGAPIRFAGFLNQSQIVDGYLAADVLVLPSESETWGLVAHEAMFCGRPCIVSERVGCGPDLVIPGVTGDFFPCGDIRSLADRLIFYAGSSSRLMTMGEHARNRIAKYSIREAVNGVLQALATVMEARRLPHQSVASTTQGITE